MKIRVYKKSDLEDVISLIERSNFTNRTAETWNKNNMKAILAFDNDKLIGAYPLQPRKLSIGDEFINVLFATSVYINRKFRRKGIGTLMNDKIKEAFDKEYEGIFVYKNREGDAYKWYQSLGYNAYIKILSLNKTIDKIKTHNNFLYYDSTKDLNKVKKDILDCYELHNNSYAGGAYHHNNYWSKYIAHSYHKEHYKYSFIINPSKDNKKINSYAFLGETAIRDGIKRFDILEQCVSNNSEAKEVLFDSILEVANKKRLKEIRIQVSKEDNILNWIQKSNFTIRWEFDLLGYLFNPIDYLLKKIERSKKLRDCHKFILITDNGAQNSIGKGSQHLALSISDDELSKLVLNRLDMRSSMMNGRIKVIKENKEILNRIISLFPKTDWQFQHMEYV